MPHLGDIILDNFEFDDFEAPPQFKIQKSDSDEFFLNERVLEGVDKQKECLYEVFSAQKDFILVDDNDDDKQYNVGQVPICFNYTKQQKYVNFSYIVACFEQKTGSSLKNFDMQIFDTSCGMYVNIKDVENTQVPIQALNKIRYIKLSLRQKEAVEEDIHNKSEISDSSDQLDYPRKEKNLNRPFNQEDVVQKEKRVRERTIEYVLEKLSEWRNLFSHGNDGQSKVKLKEAADIVGLPKKSLDNYYLQYKKGMQYGFDFSANIHKKIGALRKFIKEYEKYNPTQKSFQNNNYETYLSKFQTQTANQVQQEVSKNEDLDFSTIFEPEFDNNNDNNCNIFEDLNSNNNILDDNQNQQSSDFECSDFQDQSFLQEDNQQQFIQQPQFIQQQLNYNQFDKNMQYNQCSNFESEEVRGIFFN